MTQFLTPSQSPKKTLYGYDSFAYGLVNMPFDSFVSSPLIDFVDTYFSLGCLLTAGVVIAGVIMATEPKAATEEAKIDLFEDDDEFEEFEINEEWEEDKEEGKEVTQQWEDDWDDDDVNDDFSLQLRRELENNSEK
ncbi:DSS1/SEM [Trema orientale]|uniref:26S proteasome complex subunit SEM1 n=1 Tax=Trema orientale TaxID=63057 RepID=A0A2P5EL07_TREOI|nr:DSS1/SEM [Trema orientale]